MSTRGVKRYLSCLDYLEAKYSSAIDEEEYTRRKQLYESFDQAELQSQAIASGKTDGAQLEPDEEIIDEEDDTEDEEDDDSVGSLAEFIAEDEEDDN